MLCLCMSLCIDKITKKKVRSLQGADKIKVRLLIKDSELPVVLHWASLKGFVLWSKEAVIAIDNETGKICKVSEITYEGQEFIMFDVQQFEAHKVAFSNDLCVIVMINCKVIG